LQENSSDNISKKISRRIAENSLRVLQKENSLIDFCSNDYLGFARNTDLHESIIHYDYSCLKNYSGSTGSRLLTGNNNFVQELEADIALFHSAENGLIYNSGYTANIGLLSAIAEKDDTVIFDALCHASIRDGVILSKSKSIKFRHNDINHLEEILKKTNGNKYVVIESVYSMDGDSAPLYDLACICEKHNANLIVDEAHATGIFGNNGEGLVNELNLRDKVFAGVHTFGKALGCHGAIVLGSEKLIQYLINFSRAFIYTTALPAHNLVAIKKSYEKLKKADYNKLRFKNNIRLFKEKAKKSNLNFIESNSAIHSLIIKGNTEAKNKSEFLKQQGFDVRAVLSPTVAEGTERLRFCIHEFNTSEEIERLFELL
jgi:8-amino-7-oxononanoate synthase